MSCKSAASVAAIVLLAASATSALAQTTPSGDSAAPASLPPVVSPICTDRPTKANVTCTVPEESIQIEADAINWTRNSDAGVRTDTILYTNPTIKYGLGSHTDIEFNIAPYETVRVQAGGTSGQIGGVGDLYIRLKQGLTAASSKVQVSLIPYIKAPTARVGVGNGKVEGGVIAPVVFTLPGGVALNFGPEVDILENGDGRGHHEQLVALANLSKSVGKTTFYAEFWNAQNFDPAATVHQYSADVAGAYLIKPTLQVDLGGNFGLNRATPDAQLYVGISTRF